MRAKPQARTPRTRMRAGTQGGWDMGRTGGARMQDWDMRGLEAGWGGFRETRVQDARPGCGAEWDGGLRNLGRGMLAEQLAPTRDLGLLAGVAGVPGVARVEHFLWA